MSMSNKDKTMHIYFSTDFDREDHTASYRVDYQWNHLKSHAKQTIPNTGILEYHAHKLDHLFAIAENSMYSVISNMGTPPVDTLTIHVPDADEQDIEYLKNLVIKYPRLYALNCARPNEVRPVSRILFTIDTPEKEGETHGN